MLPWSLPLTLAHFSNLWRSTIYHSCHLKLKISACPQAVTHDLTSHLLKIIKHTGYCAVFTVQILTHSISSMSWILIVENLNLTAVIGLLIVIVSKINKVFWTMGSSSAPAQHLSWPVISVCLLDFQYLQFFILQLRANYGLPWLMWGSDYRSVYSNV